LTQQLSGPVTDPKRCVTIHVVLVVGGGDGFIGEEPPHAASDSANARARMDAFIAGASP
jgi:hypothetical protein